MAKKLRGRNQHLVIENEGFWRDLNYSYIKYIKQLNDKGKNMNKETTAGEVLKNYEFYNQSKDRWGMICDCYMFGSDTRVRKKESLPEASTGTPMPKCKPPLGLMPEHICISQRLKELDDAISRYIEARKDIPWSWVAEKRILISRYNELKQREK